MKITILQQNEYPNGYSTKEEANHLTFIRNTDKYYITKWGVYPRRSDSDIIDRQEFGVLTTFRYDYDDKTN